MTISGKAKIAGVIGWPIGHSLSPALHGFWIGQHQLDAAYVPFAVRPEDFTRVVGLMPAQGLRGANVTLPHKEAAYLLCDERDEAAVATGAVNTLVFEGGRVLGRNTDVFGFTEALREDGVGDLSGKKAVVLGAGGAARAIVFALLSMGVARVVVVNRTIAKAQSLAVFFGAHVEAQAWENVSSCLADCDVLVNTTSLGMKGQPDLQLDLGTLKSDAVVSDIVYRPLETNLLQQAKARGHRIVGGLGMLLHQARPGFAAWFGVEPQVSPALRAHLVSVLEGRA
jgi:shikimate dehydrogenase